MTRKILNAGLVALTCGLLLQPAPAYSGPRERAPVAKKYPFKDLPGVDIPEDELKPRLVCKTELRFVRDYRTAGRYPRRVYICREGNMVFESTTPPSDYEWSRYKQHLGN